MSDTTPTDTRVIVDDFAAFDQLHTFAGATDLVRAAIDSGISVVEPIRVGDFGVILRRPGGDPVEIDMRRFEDEPRMPTFITGTYQFVGVRSLAGYVSRHADENTTVAYVHDVYGKGTAMLTSDTKAAFVILDDHAGAQPQRRAHKAELVLRPTAAARRWGKVLAAPAIDQETFLDLVVDGIGEIAEPAGATLRDLVSDLHAIRSTEVKSVIRTGGEGAIELAENVKLHAGSGVQVTFPETMQIVLQPFAGVPDTMVLDITIKPAVTAANKVVFGLHCGTLDDKLAHVVASVADDITDQTGLPCHWIP